MKFLLIATFKSNKTQDEVKVWLEEVSPVASTSQAQVIIAPSYPHLSLLAKNQELTTNSLASCAQDVSPFPPGSYTGAVSATQLKDLGLRYCIIGHSERRRHFHETHLDIASKSRELTAQGITPIICLSKDDITPQLAAMDDSEIKQSIFVYEPPADIGGTETASIDDIKDTCELIISLTSCPVMYGGSVNASNLESLLNLGLAGVLVGSASLSSNTFIDIINRYDSLRGE